MFCLLSLRCLGQITFFEKRTKHGYITQREFPKGERFQTHWYSLYLEPQSTTPIKSRQCGWSPLTLRVQYRNPIREAPYMLQLECIVSNLQKILPGRIFFFADCNFWRKKLFFANSNFWSPPQIEDDNSRQSVLDRNISLNSEFWSALWYSY